MPKDKNEENEKPPVNFEEAQRRIQAALEKNNKLKAQITKYKQPYKQDIDVNPKEQNQSAPLGPDPLHAERFMNDVKAQKGVAPAKKKANNAPELPPFRDAVSNKEAQFTALLNKLKEQNLRQELNQVRKEINNKPTFLFKKMREKLPLGKLTNRNKWIKQLNQMAEYFLSGDAKNLDLNKKASQVYNDLGEIKDSIGREMHLSNSGMKKLCEDLQNELKNIQGIEIQVKQSNTQKKTNP
ncbi:MAG TPA: hypothetical protein VFP93_01925 [Gammaproteobacteria bacterium]|nr:hypothetical protein [Gammaproteobacteria bacterium]